MIEREVLLGYFHRLEVPMRISRDPVRLFACLSDVPKLGEKSHGNDNN
jgi:hypothetical protein